MSEPNHKPSCCREDLPFIIYLCLSTLYLGAQMFQGLSFLDIGMYMSGYEHIASDPYPSVFLGQWLLSFTVSSLILRLFHADSFLAMRLMFLVFSVIMQVVAYISCKRYVPRRYVIAGLALTVLSIFGAYTEMTYNDYTALLFMAALLSYHKGQSSSLLYIAVSGFLIALAFFFRITNLAFVVFPLAAWLMGRLVPWGVHPFRLQALTFAAGWVVGFALTYLLVIATGYGDIMAFTLQSIIHIGGNSADAHNMKAILICFYEIHKTEISATSVILVVTAFMWLAYSRLTRLVRTGILAFLFCLTMVCIYFWEHPSSITIGISIFGFALCLASKDASPALKHFFALCLCLPLLEPLGSNAGPAFACKGTCLLSLPLALYAFDQQGRKLLATLSSNATLSNNASSNNSLSSSNASLAYPRALRLAFVAVCMGMVYTNIFRPMMEDGNRPACLHTVDSKLTGPIMTTKENADTHNHLIKHVKPLLPDGSYLISDGSLTAISLLGCRPYAVFSTVFSADAMNERYIRFAFNHTHRLPYYLADAEAQNEKNLFVLNCLKTISPYKAVWTDGRFTLWKPETDNGERKQKEKD